MSRFPKQNHEAILSGLTGEPDSMDVIVDATMEIQKRLVEVWGWNDNHMISGVVMDILWGVYCAGERRGVARELRPATALFPVQPVLDKLHGVG